MIYFQDELKHCQRFRSDELTKMATIIHYSDSGDDDDCDFDSQIFVAGKLMPDDISSRRGSFKSLPTLRLVMPGGDPLSALTLFASAEIDISDDYGLITPMDFIQNYKDILTGRNTDWRLCAVKIYPSNTYLCYANHKNEELEEICIHGCPLQFAVEVPQEEEMSLLNRAYAQLMRRPDDTAERIIIQQDLEGNKTQIWAGQLRDRVDKTALQPGQRSLATEYDEDGDIQITRMYHMSDLTEDFLREALEYNSKHSTFLL